MDTIIPEPSVQCIDYARPEEYLTLNASLGSQERIQEAAAALLQEEPEQTLGNIGRWIQQNLKYDAHCAYAWRNFDTAVETQTFGGCADHVFGGVCERLLASARCVGDEDLRRL